MAHCSRTSGFQKKVLGPVPSEYPIYRTWKDVLSSVGDLSFLMTESAKYPLK